MISCYFEDGKKARGKGLRHVVTDCVVFSQDKKQILMVKRSPTMLVGANLWALPGGYLDFDESIEDAVVREVLEETGYRLQDKPKMMFYKDETYRGDSRQNVSWVWCGVAGEQVGEPDKESVEVRWWPVNALPNDAEIAFDHKEIIEKSLVWQKDHEEEKLKMMLAAKAVILRENERGETELLIARFRKETAPVGRRWDLPGGRVDPTDADLKETLRRELGEELGWSEELIDSLCTNRLFGVIFIDRPTSTVRRAFSLMELRVPQGMEIDVKLSEEHITWKWYSVERLLELTDEKGQPTDWAARLYYLIKNSC
ncbi:MAG: NUDIX hydrolase [Pseudomonadales bacterium]|jgi:8-oxo-dGTP pyrophosphatase MutT (NUDIX family)|nr:NUDIX hydrolase [Pseudomonadales bacterium]